MQYNEKVNRILAEMGNDLKINQRKINSEFKDLIYLGDNEKPLFHIFVEHKHNEEKCLLAIKALLNSGVNPNAKDSYDYNFIQMAIYSGYSEYFITKIIKESLKHNLDVNHVDINGNTIMHSLIYSVNYIGDIINIYNLLCENGFDSSILDNEGRNVLDSLKYEKKLSKQKIQEFEEVFNYRKNSVIVEKVKTYETEMSEIEQYGKILNNKNFNFEPIIGREEELEKLIITLAQDKKSPILVGDAGVGKTSLVEQLVYMVKNNKVPNFLKNRIIFEINPSEIVSGSRYRGEFEENMTMVMEWCIKNNAIVFIDEIHMIYGMGSAKGQKNDMASMLRYYVDRTDLKVIGTTTTLEYEEVLANSSLKRRFERINIGEPKDNLLYYILDKVIDDCSERKCISIQNNITKRKIINSIIELTKENNRVYNDRVNNPDLAISIIDRAFAIAIVRDSKTLELEHIIKSISDCDRIYNGSKERIIYELKELEPQEQSTKAKILRINFNK